MKVKAVVVDGTGGPNVLRVSETDVQWPAGPEDVLVRLKAASVNPADVFFRENGGYVRTGAPMVLGHDGAGVVEATGPDCRAIRPGDRVCFCYGGIGGAGTYAEAAVVPERFVVQVPQDISLMEAAAVPLVSITATESLRDRLRLAVGQSILIHAGAGGTGHIAIQIARRIGARVATTISSPEKRRMVEEIGADLAINYRQDDFAEAAMHWTDGRGLDAAFDNVGGDVLLRTFRAMRPYGHVVTLMGLSSEDGGTAYNSNLSIHNEMMLTPMWLNMTERLAAQAQMVRDVLGLMREGDIRVRIAAEFPLDRVANAHVFIEKGHLAGKIVLSIDG